MDSVYVLPSTPLDSCSLLILALLLRTMITMAVVKITALVIKATARELVVIQYTIALSVLIMYCASAMCTVIELLVLPTRIPHNQGSPQGKLKA